MIRSFAIAMICALGSVPGIAQPLAVDIAVVRACFADSPRGISMPDCVGSAARQCQSQPGGMTDAGISDCINAEAAAWDILLNEQYEATLNAFQVADIRTPLDTAKRDEALRDAQRAWISFRNTDCWMQYVTNQTGSPSPVFYESCLRRMTAQRTFELRNMVELG